MCLFPILFISGNRGKRHVVMSQTVDYVSPRRSMGVRSGRMVAEGKMMRVFMYAVFVYPLSVNRNSR